MDKEFKDTLNLIYSIIDTSETEEIAEKAISREFLIEKPQLSQIGWDRLLELKNEYYDQNFKSDRK